MPNREQNFRIVVTTERRTVYQIKARTLGEAIASPSISEDLKIDCPGKILESTSSTKVEAY